MKVVLLGGSTAHLNDAIYDIYIAEGIVTMSIIVQFWCCNIAACKRNIIMLLLLIINEPLRLRWRSRDWIFTEAR